MVNVLCILSSARSQGYSADLLGYVVKGIKSVPDVSCEVVKLTDFMPISPCISCWSCARGPEHRCVLDDSMGRMGEGELIRKVVDCNGLFIAQPVYFTRPPASTQLFFERLYPFRWSGELNGLPFGSLSQAANNGGTRMADYEMSKWAFTHSFWYMGGIPVHMIQYKAAKIEALKLGEKLAKASIEDEAERKGASLVEKFQGSDGNPWDPLMLYIDDLSNGTFAYEGSLVELALQNEGISEEIEDLLEESAEHFKKMMQLYHIGDKNGAIEELVKMRPSWGRATVKMFLDDDLQLNR